MTTIEGSRTMGPGPAHQQRRLAVGSRYSNDGPGGWCYTLRANPVTADAQGVQFAAGRTTPPQQILPAGGDTQARRRRRARAPGQALTGRTQRCDSPNPPQTIAEGVPRRGAGCLRSRRTCAARGAENPCARPIAPRTPRKRMRHGNTRSRADVETTQRSAADGQGNSVRRHVATQTSSVAVGTATHAGATLYARAKSGSAPKKAGG